MRLQKQCNVCLQGALVLSKARLFDDVILGNLAAHPMFAFKDICTNFYAGYSNVSNVLKDIFDQKTLHLAESAFERTILYSMYDVEALKCAIAFSCQFKTKRQVVMAVMKNIIKNKGKFIPPKLAWDDNYICKPYLEK